jgi:hypothetical protein
MSSIAQLEAVVNKLPEYRQSFAKSLIRQAPSGLSREQAFWVDKLVEIANGGAQERETVDVGNMAGAIALFDKAADHLKFPKVRLRVMMEPVHRDIRLAVAGHRARVPGSINVSDDAPYGAGNWYGRIHRDGRFEKNDAVEVPAKLVELLKRFAEHPAETAAEFGRLTGHCCFCDRHLEDERSTEVGYGPVCAKRWGLPWGSK